MKRKWLLQPKQYEEVAGFVVSYTLSHDEVYIAKPHLYIVCSLVLDKCLGSTLHSGPFVLRGICHHLSMNRKPDGIKNLYECCEEERKLSPCQERRTIPSVVAVNKNVCIGHNNTCISVIL